MADGKTFECAIITPEAKVFEGPVQFVALPAHDGEIGVLRDRAPLLCKLGIGVLRLREHAGTRRWFVDGGFAQVIENRVTVLTQRALAPDAVNRAAAEEALEAARHMEARDDAARQARSDAAARARAQIRLTSGS